MDQHRDPTPHRDTDRHPAFVGLEGCVNFRDLGGRPTTGGAAVRRGVLYRSDSLHRLTPGDLARVLGELGVATAIDLRTAEEQREVGVAPTVDELDVRHVPTLDETLQAPFSRSGITSIVEGYGRMLTGARRNIGAAIEALAWAPGPAVFFCMAGKDRTGLVAAVVLGLVGVPDDEIGHDYSLTADVLDRILEALRGELPDAEQRWSELGPDVMSARADAMVETIARLRLEHGGFEGYAAAAGIDDATIAQLRTRLLA